MEGIFAAAFEEQATITKSLKSIFWNRRFVLCTFFTQFSIHPFPNPFINDQNYPIRAMCIKNYNNSFQWGKCVTIYTQDFALQFETKLNKSYQPNQSDMKLWPTFHFCNVKCRHAKALIPTLPLCKYDFILYTTFCIGLSHIYHIIHFEWYWL